MCSERARLDVLLVLDRVPHLVGDTDPTALGERADARGDVDAVAGDLPVLHDHVAQVDAHVQLQVGVVTSGRLDCQRAVHRVERRRERGERLVPPRLDRLAVVPLDQGSNQDAVTLAGSEPLLFALRHQRRVAHDVGEHDRGEAAGRAGHRAGSYTPPGRQGQNAMGIGW